MRSRSSRAFGGKSVMTFVGGAIALDPLAGAACLALLAVLSCTRGGFALGARVGVFAFPVLQLFTAPVEQVAATGGLMCLVGARFLLAGRSGRATSVPGESPTT